MANCREVTRKLASDEVSEEGLGGKISVWFHLLLCRHCRRYAQQLQDLRQAARKLWRKDAEEVPDELEDRIVEGLLTKEDP